MVNASTVERHLHELTRFPDRHVGGEGNAAATTYFAETVAGFGWQVAVAEFPCLEWEFGAASLEVAGERFDANVGPYSPPLKTTGRLQAASTVEEIEAGGLEGAILLLHGDIASGQIMPKSFNYYNPASHRRIIAALEAAMPVAVVAATGTDPYMVGGQYPFPLFEDGDFLIPNAFLTDLEGARLLGHAGSAVALRIDSRRVPSTAEHVIATLPGALPGRIIVSAHIDSRKGSPGALDNATGVVTLLGVAELLGKGGGRELPTIELVPFNGEDNYANPGEHLWEAENEGRFGEIILGINVDDSAQVDSENHVSFYNCPAGVEAAVREAMCGRERLGEGPQWNQGDHAILGIHKVPAVAIASSEMLAFMEQYAHTERDTLDLADASLVVVSVEFIGEAIGAVAAATAG